MKLFGFEFRRATPEIEVITAQRIMPRDGDRFVIHCDSNLNIDQIERIKAAWEQGPLAEFPVMVMQSGMRLSHFAGPPKSIQPQMPSPPGPPLRVTPR